MEEWRHHQPDGTAINMPEYMAADFAIRRADIGARRTTNAVQCFLELWQVTHLPAAVIQQNYMLRMAGCWPLNECGVRRDPLAGGITGQQSHLGHRIFIRWNELFDTCQHHMHR